MNKVYRALADPTRREIIRILRQEDKTAGELCEYFPHTAPTMSRHFNVLKEADLIQGDKSGTTITYRVNVSVLEEALLALLDQFQLSSEEESEHE